MEASRREESIELARTGIEAWNAGDVETVLGLLHPEIEVFTAPGLVNSGTYRGHQGFLAWAGQWTEAWESFHSEIERIYALDEGYVIAELHQTGRGAGSGISVEMSIAYLFEVSDGLVTRVQLHPDAAAARAAAEELAGAAGA